MDDNEDSNRNISNPVQEPLRQEGQGEVTSNPLLQNRVVTTANTTLLVEARPLDEDKEQEERQRQRVRFLTCISLVMFLVVVGVVVTIVVVVTSNNNRGGGNAVGVDNPLDQNDDEIVPSQPPTPAFVRSETTHFPSPVPSWTPSSLPSVVPSSEPTVACPKPHICASISVLVRMVFVAIASWNVMANRAATVPFASVWFVNKIPSVAALRGTTFVSNWLETFVFAKPHRRNLPPCFPRYGPPLPLLLLSVQPPHYIQPSPRYPPSHPAGTARCQGHRLCGTLERVHL